MSNNNNTANAQSLFIMTIGASFVLLLLHFYYYCHDTFYQWQLTHDLTDHIVTNIEKTGFFDHVYTSKLWVVLCLILSTIGAGPHKDNTTTYRSCTGYLVIGAGFYSLSDLLLISRNHHPGSLTTFTIIYITLTLTGYLLILIGLFRLARILPSPFRHNDPFGRDQAGFPQEHRFITSDFSINLSAIYKEKGKKKASWINIINSRRGVLIIGSPGCGKSWFIIEPIIHQLIQKGFALFVFDFKYPTLTRFTYHHFREHSSAYPSGTRFYSINFSDPSHSHRCNILAPHTLEKLSDALGASRTIMLSMNKTWVHKQGDFFVETPINFLAALIWFLRRYKDGQYCTLPHAIELAQLPYKDLFSILDTEQEIQVLINPFIEAFNNKNWELLDSQAASAKVPLGRLSSPDLYYVLTGHDFDLDINNPAAPKIFCLGGDPRSQEALAPIISLYIDRLTRIVNQPNKYKCALVCDEFATARAYSMSTTIATGRSNNIVPVIAIQDLSQLRTQYSREEADLFLNISGNLLCGQVGGETARWISERFPRLLQDKASYSTNSSDTSISHSRQWEPSVTAATIATLSSGEFLGIVADDPDQPLELKAFHAQIRKPKIPHPPSTDELPVVQKIENSTIQRNFQRVRVEIQGLAKEVLNHPQ